MIPVVGVLHALRTVDAQKSQSSGGGDQPGTGEVLDIIHDIAIHPKCKQLELFCICRKITPGPPGKLHRRSGYDL